MDADLNKFYSQGAEKDRLLLNQLERDRTFHLLKRFLPSPPATILDIGGAAGVYAIPLAQHYEVHLLDPVALHIEQARISSKALASANVGDARALPFADATADVVLLLGPLYHLPASADRQKALAEAYRVLKPRGILFAAGISRFASYIDYMNKKKVYSKIPIIEQDFSTGLHRKVSAHEDFIFGYFHRPQELKQEVEMAGFSEVSLRAIEGPAWGHQVIDALYEDQANWPRLISLLDQIDTEESILGASAHIMAIGRKGVS